MEKLILEFVVRSALLAACTAGALYLLRVKAARVRHAVWASVVVLMLVLPAWTAWGPKAVLRVLTPTPAVVDVQPVAVQQVASDSNVPALPVRDPGWTWRRLLIALYLLGFGVLMARLITGTIRTRMLMRRAAKRAGRLTSDSCVTPVTVGWLAPSVILPTGWSRWPRAQLNAVLAHEDEHARRRDPLVQWLALLNRAVFWFHPLAWWLERRLSGLAEEACDDAVLVRGHDPLEYSEYLLGLARVVRKSGSRVAVVGMTMPGTYLPARIRRIAGGAQVQRISRGRLVSVVVVCAAVSTVFTAGAIGYSVPEVHSGTSAVAAAPAPAVPAPAVDVQSVIHSSSPEVKEVKVAKKATVLLAQAAVASPAPVAAGNAATTDQSLFGVVTDPTGAVVANAPVTLTNSSAGTTISTKSDAVGRFRFQNIDPGTYSVMLRVPGFRGLTQTGINVAVGEALNVGTMSLQVGSIAESVSVTGSRSAPVAAAASIGNPIGPATYIAPGPPSHVGIPLDQPAPPVPPAGKLGGLRGQTGSLGPQRVGGMVQAAKILSEPKPVYPPDLQRAGVQGTVRFEAVISKDGLPVNLQVISSPDPGLTQAATDAVNQWKYQPTRLNGEPVEVLTTIDVNFSVTN